MREGGKFRMSDGMCWILVVELLRKEVCILCVFALNALFVHGRGSVGWYGLLLVFFSVNFSKIAINYFDFMLVK